MLKLHAHNIDSLTEDLPAKSLKHTAIKFRNDETLIKYLKHGSFYLETIIVCCYFNLILCTGIVLVQSFANLRLYFMRKFKFSADKIGTDLLIAKVGFEESHRN